MPESVNIHGNIGAELEFCGLPALWLESTYATQGWTFSGGTREGQELSLKEVWESLVPGVQLPFDMDLRLRDISLEIFIGSGADSTARDYKLSLEAGVTLTLKPSEDLESRLNIEKIAFIYNKVQSDEKQTSINLKLNGDANVNEEIVITDYTFEYDYKYDAETQQTEWLIGGELYLLAFQRLMAFKAGASSLKDEQQISFSFESSQPVLHAAYFNRIKSVAAGDVMTALNGGTSPMDGQILISALPDDVISRLGDSFTLVQKEEIAGIIARARRANEPLISIPDLFHDNKPICTISPRLFRIKLARASGRFKSIDFAIGADLTVYNNLAGSGELFSISNGVLSSGFDKVKKRFYLSYEADQTLIKPLSAISMLPGITDMLISAFGETADSHPKTNAFVNMLEIRPEAFSFIRQENKWQVRGGVRLVLNDGLRTVDGAFYEFIEKIFPKTGDARYINGYLSFDSAEGLYFVLENNNGIEVPNFMKMAAESIDPQFKADFKQKTAIDLDQALDLGTSFIILDRVRFKIAKQAEMDMRIGIGLPSNLNDRLFNPSSKIHGLINTYDRKKFEKANKKKNAAEAVYNTPLPDDNLVRATLKIGTEGISGQLDQFNVFNLEKIAEEFKGLVTEESEHVIIDLNALTNESEKQYGKIELEKPRFKVDFKTCSFTIGGGFRLLSDTLRIPVRPLVKKLIAILPTDKFDTRLLNTIADQLTNHISIQGINFFDASSGRLQLDRMTNFFKQFLLEEHKKIDLLPPDLVGFVEKHSTEITKHLPEMLLQYLSIKIPSGFKFNIEVTADKSVSFAVEVPEPTPAQKEAGFSDCLQLLLPDFNPVPMMLVGIRLKKIGLGSGLFNQAIRLDLSAELTLFPYSHMIAGAGLSVIRHEISHDYRVQHMVPNVKCFGYSYKIDNLLMLIFPQTKVPIPVPVFYDNFSIYAAGIEGSRTEFAIRFPRPKLNIGEIFSSLGELVKFFKDKDFALPVTSYGTIRRTEEISADSIVPVFYAGPVYMELPGLLGYQKFPDGSKKNITIGFKDLKVLNPKELVALAANSAKFAIRSVTEKQRLRVKVNDSQSEYPVNYLVKFLPASQRIGTSSLVLFDVLEANLAWALSTPGEFKEQVYPLLLAEQLKNGRTGINDNWSATELLSIIPNSDKWNNEDEGVVLFLKGSVNLAEQFAIDTVNAVAVTNAGGFSAGIAMRSRLAKIFDMELGGGIKLDADSAGFKFGLAGKTTLTIFRRITVLKGRFLLEAGEQSHFKFYGLLDLFPDELFQGGRSPVQLYTGTEKGIKSDITGVIGRNSINVGHYNADGSISAAGVHLEIGNFHLAGTTRIITSSDKQEWELKLICYGTELALNAGIFAVENGSRIQFSISANTTIGIENLLTISGTEPGSGAEGKLVFTYRDQSLMPEFTEFYLNGAISLLGLSSSAYLHIKKDEFVIDLNNNLGILDAALKVSGRNFAEASGFMLAGSIGLLGNLCKVGVDLRYFKTPERSIFKGSGYLEFWGARRMELQVDAGQSEGNPYFNAEGTLDLSLPGVMRLYTGTKDGLSNIRGVINKDKLDLNGSIYFQLDAIQAGGGFEMKADDESGFVLSGYLFFNAGLMTGGSVDVAIAKSGDLLCITGTSEMAISLLPGLFDLAQGSSLTIRMNQVTNQVELFQLTGNVNMLGSNAAYELEIKPGSFWLKCDLILPVVDMSVTARSENLTSADYLKLSGNINMGRLNAAIDKFYETIGIRGKMNDKINAITSGVTSLTNARADMQYKQGRINFINQMDSKWNKNGNDPDGFQFCVPPVYHVEYWSESRWALPPRYSKNELAEVRQYYQYKRELGLPANEPTRHDIGRFVNGVLQAINNKAYEIGIGISNTFRQVINEVHRVITNDILKNLNIDTTDLNRLNDAFNSGINTLNDEAAKWRDLNHRLLNYKPLEINEITYTDQSIDLLRTKSLTAKVTFTVLNDPQRTVEQVLDLNDPVGGLVKNASQFLPEDLRRLIGY